MDAVDGRRAETLVRASGANGSAEVLTSMAVAAAICLAFFASAFSFRRWFATLF